MTAAAAAAAAERLADCTAWPSSAAQRWVHGAVARRPPPHTVVDFHLSAMTAELRDVYGRPPPSDKFEEYNLVGYSRGRTTADAVVTHSGSEHNRRTFSFVCDERAAEGDWTARRSGCSIIVSRTRRQRRNNSEIELNSSSVALLCVALTRSVRCVRADDISVGKLHFSSCRHSSLHRPRCVLRENKYRRPIFLCISDR